jgi:hypothetical protein
LAATIAFAPASASAQVSEPAPRPDQQFDFMNLLAHHGLHDLNDEAWNAYGQFTFISSYKFPFSAAYTSPRRYSLGTEGEWSWTGTVTAYIGVRLWYGGEAYFVPEVIAERALSNLKGLGGAIQNFELQKNGGIGPQLYRARAFVQQTIGFGGTRQEKTSDPMQLGTVVDSRRLVLRVGNFSVIDFLDKNTFAGDLRQQFFNMAFLTYAAYDFAADARGYSWGFVAEGYYDDWTLRFGRVAPPIHPNVLPLTFRLDAFYGDQVEIEHNHQIAGRPGAVRVLAYRNRENMGRFDDALAAFKANPAQNAATCPDFSYYDPPESGNPSAPDLCWARKPNVKVGIGLNLEQQVTEDIGVFFRGMISDGQTEVYSFTSTDQSVAFGVLGKGSLWHRPADVSGIGVGLGWISKSHADYLRLGGVDGFIGDGTITPATESVLDVFYSVNFLSSVWLSADYQHITNPAFNADRGPVDIIGARVHAEF